MGKSRLAEKTKSIAARYLVPRFFLSTERKNLKILGFDTETFLITPGNSIPKMVCLTTSKRELFKRDEAVEWFDNNLGTNLLVAHNLFFDLAVCYEAYKDKIPNLLNRIFHAIDNGLVACTEIRERMIAVATGTNKFYAGKPRMFSLASCVNNYFGIRVEKEDTWRLRYSELEAVPLSEWPEDAKEYAISDAEWALKVYEGQGGIPLHQEISQVQAMWGLYLTAAYGLRTDPVEVEALSSRIERSFLEAREVVIEAGLMNKKTKRNGEVKYSKHMASIKNEILISSEGKGVKKTPKGAISTAAEVVDSLAGYPNDPDDESFDAPGIANKGLYALSKMKKYEKLLSTYVPILRLGAESAIVTRYISILETYRTSSRNPGVQVMPRIGGIREAFVPRNGNVFLFCDYDTIELRSLTQINIELGHNPKMLEALNAGKDLHLAFAASMLGIAYEEAVTRKKEGDPEVIAHRQYAKCANFGIPGGMGAKAFVDYCKGMGVTITLDFAKRLKRDYLEEWTEMPAYFRYCSDLMQGAERARMQFIRSGLVRDGVHYCSACNGFFQHLAAMGAKQALYEVVKECLTDTNSPLYGCRPVLFLHDEIGMEVPDDDKLQERSIRLQEIMIKEMCFWIPDVPITCEPVVMRRWYKGAESVYVDGKIVPSVKKGDLWVHDIDTQKKRSSIGT